MRDITGLKVFSVSFFRSDQSAYESERAGAGRGVFFVNFLRSLVRNHWAVWADWELWIHHDDRAMQFPYWKSIKKMSDNGLLKLFYMGPSKRICESMLHRMVPCWNESVEYTLCRDLDSLSTPRERAAIDRWIKSSKAVSSLHDSPSHVSAMMLGGLVGFRGEWVRSHWNSWEEFIALAEKHGEDLSIHGSDQHLLAKEVFPKCMQDNQFVYENSAMMGPKVHPIDFVGTHAGGAFHVDPAVRWFSENRAACPKLDLIEECERV